MKAGKAMNDPATPTTTTTSQKVDDSIEEVSAVLDSILSRFGHTNVAGAVEQYASLAPVFVSLAQTIVSLLHHKKAAATS